MHLTTTTTNAASATAATATSRPHAKRRKLARLLGSSTAGVLELACFHPVDTLTKRLMTHQGQVIGSGLAHTARRLNTIIFREAANGTALQKYRSLFPGLGFAFGYKVSQRIYKFGGQPVVREYLEKRWGTSGGRGRRLALEGTAGSIIGIGEVCLLPLDVLKIKSQTNPEALKGKNILRIFRNDFRELYRGAGWTAARNAPGSFALFGGNSFCQAYILRLSPDQKPSFLQTFISSIFGSVASIAISAPLDVVKTRLQKQGFGEKLSGGTVVKRMIREEGVRGFFRGIVPKTMVVGPKLIFSFSVAQQLMLCLEGAL